MKILLVHNYTGDFVSGGEATVFEEETEQLRSRGHDVQTLTCANSEAMSAGFGRKICYFISSPWSRDGFDRVKAAVEQFGPDIVHVHNFFMILSPSVFRAASECGVPVVATLHNYRFVVPCSQLLRHGHVCMRCLGKNPWRILLYRCYRNSLFASLLRYRFYYLSQKRKDWLSDISCFIALTGAQKRILEVGGVPSEKIWVKGNSIDVPSSEMSQRQLGEGAVFAGRLAVEKGVESLLKAWEGLDYPLTIIGEGPLKKSVLAAVAANKNIKYAGLLPRDEVLSLFYRSRFVIVPSVYHEPFGLVNIEAMSVGTPVLAASIGAMTTLINHDVTGCLFEPGDVISLREQALRLINDEGLCNQIGENARRLYLNEFTPQKNYDRLIEIYESCLSQTV